MPLKILLLIALIMGIRYLLAPGEVELGPGARAPAEPYQSMIDDQRHFELHGYRITPLAEFSIKAKLLAREDYRFGREADLSPVDFALGWGRMSDEAVLDDIEISQSGRWYRWRTASFPIPRREIETHSANMHLIPADEAVGDVIGAMRKGQVVELSGFLVSADADDGWRWVSSLSRQDTGGRSCELIYVRRAKIVRG
ncbi:MAG: hypothetical protein KDI88_17015 [Gammaproteobacteria bacterium]|nr:hypothetical protein [Gammaproteobacteria bacterium]